MSDGDISKRECHRTASVRTEAIMSAIMTMRDALASEKEIGKVGSAYMTIHSIVYDMIEGTYWEGYTTGEDQAHRPCDDPHKEPK